MRRKDREVTDYGRMLEIMNGCDVCRLGLADAGAAYIIPLNFGWEERGGKLFLYFHGARQGRKIDLIEEQESASFEMDRKHELIEGEAACTYSFRYQSVMGRGKIRILKEDHAKIHGLERIMEHYAGDRHWTFDREAAGRVHVMELEVTEWSAKEH